MRFRILDVPTCSTSDVKKAPNAVFQQAEKAGTPVYVLNRGEVAGVMMTRAQYESLIEQMDLLRQLADIAIFRKVTQNGKNVEFELNKSSDDDGNVEYDILVGGDEVARAVKEADGDFDIWYDGKTNTGGQAQVDLDGYGINHIDEVLERVAEVWFNGRVLSE